MTWQTSAAIGIFALFAVYLVILFRIAFAKPRIPATTEQVAYKLRSILATADLDCETALLWQTQAFGLQKLRESDQGLSLESMRLLYSHFSRHYPELCEGSDFDEWLDTLQDAEVITPEEGRIRVTEK